MEVGVSPWYMAIAFGIRIDVFACIVDVAVLAVYLQVGNIKYLPKRRTACTCRGAFNMEQIV